MCRKFSFPTMGFPIHIFQSPLRAASPTVTKALSRIYPHHGSRLSSLATLRSHRAITPVLTAIPAVCVQNQTTLEQPLPQANIAVLVTSNVQHASFPTASSDLGVSTTASNIRSTMMPVKKGVNVLKRRKQ
jgi:hypothetical protein